MQVNGQHFSGTGYQLDGTENRDPDPRHHRRSTRRSSRLARRKITSQNYDAEFGQATAGVVSVQTKSGTQRAARQRVRVLPERGSAGAQPVHAGPAGSAHRQVHSRDLRITSSADRSAGRSVPNRWFFFGDYQGTREKQGGSRLLTRCRREAARRGDLSEYGSEHLRSGDGRDSCRTRTQFPGTRFRRVGCRRRRSPSSS